MSAAARRWSWAALCILVAVPGCSIWPEPPAVPKQHDFGLPGTHAAVTLERPVQLGEVRAPAWLDDRDIHYRLQQTEPTRVRAYADNVWLAPPSRLLAQRLKESLAVSPGGDESPGYRLELDLYRFEQLFAAAGEARAVLQARVYLIAIPSGSIRASKRIEIEHATDSDIDGAVTGLARAGRDAVDAVMAWLDERIGSR